MQKRIQMIFKVSHRNPATIDDFGQKYHCDSCSKDITHLIILRCAVCTDFDLCVECFCKGTEMKDHKKNHDYRVIVSFIKAGCLGFSNFRS